MEAKDGRAIARKNALRVLRALRRFGWLRTRDISALLWKPWAPNPNNSPCFQQTVPTTSGIRMAQRTLKRLREKRLVLCSQAPNGSQIYALAEAGSRALRDMGIESVSGKDQIRNFSSAHFWHRCVANQIAISAILSGYRVSTEREIAQGLWLGGEQGIAGKKPDVLIRSRDAVWWVEVERSRKNAKDYARLLTWLGTALKDASSTTGSALLGEKMRWAKVVFVCSPAFKSKLIRDLESAGWKKNRIEELMEFHECLYSSEDIIFM